MLMIPPPSFVSLHNGYFIQTALYVQSGTTDSDLYKGFNKNMFFFKSIPIQHIAAVRDLNIICAIYN